MSQKNKTVIFDVDDTMVNWREGFACWLEYTHKIEVPRNEIHSYKFCYDLIDLYTKEIFNDWVVDFNCSDEFANLIIKPNVQDTIFKLTNEGYKIVAISSCGDSQETHDRRFDNIGHLVDTIHCLPLMQCKKDALQLYKNETIFFLDDSSEHINKAINIGIKNPCLYDENVGDIRTWHNLHETILGEINE